ncbi:MAG: flagellar protein FliT [Roseburia sp.]|nr:flagellar protein FliT [Ruminococcus sp.]MCM1154687.1 flagellar protein FliT [Roseburia sp.]MCM1242137.1 flagellar protein FliT [Roseburia sp.]
MEQNCVQILERSLEKKNQTLSKIIEQNTLQETLLKQEEFDMDAFEASIDTQNALVEELEQLDTGFESLYDRVREDMMVNKGKYQQEIASMKDLIQQITDKVVTVNAGNMRNKTLAENQFKKARANIRSGVSKSKVARGYYNNMNNLNYVSPQFYDNKK